MPTLEEWENLYNYLNDKEGDVFKSVIEGGRSGFNALLGGYSDNEGTFVGIDSDAIFWSTTACEDDEAGDFVVSTDAGTAYPDQSARRCGFSVRLFRD